MTKISLNFLLYTFLIIVCTSHIATKAPKTILVVVAHPDDENLVGAVLSRYARLKFNVQVIIATDGRDGTRVTNIPAGDSLAKIRRAESVCACERLGINQPIFLSLERLDTKIGVRPYLNARKKFILELKKHIEAIQPDIIITFGPDGEYGHSEHIVVGAGVTELLLREGWVDKYPLYFMAAKKSQVEDNEELAYVHNRYLNYAIKYEHEDESKSIYASSCYVTQFTKAELQEEEALRLKDQSNVFYFRRFQASSNGKISEELF